MLDAVFEAFGEAIREQLSYAEQQMFVGALFSGNQEGALAVLRERVQALDEAEYREFVKAARAILCEAQLCLQEVEPSRERGGGPPGGDGRLSRSVPS